MYFDLANFGALRKPHPSVLLPPRCRRVLNSRQRIVCIWSFLLLTLSFSLCGQKIDSVSPTYDDGALLIEEESSQAFNERY